MVKAKTEMVRVKKTKGKKNKAKKSVVVQRVASGFNPKRSSGPQLDAVALSHKRMLMDPCRAPLGPSTYPGSNGAVVQRFEQDFIVFNAATQTAGILVFIPGLSSFSTTPAVAVQDDGSTFNLQALSPGPGNAFLSTTSAYRCVAGCMQVYFPGTELNRSGFVGMGYGPGSMIFNYQSVANGGNGNAVSVGQVRQSQFHTERTPAGMVELKWKPGFGDQDWESPLTSAQQVATNSAAAGTRQVLTLSAGGLPASVGLRVRLIGIYEYMPQFGGSSVSTTGTSVITKNSLNDVLHSLDSAGNWFLDTAAKYGPVVGNTIAFASSLMV